MNLDPWQWVVAVVAAVLVGIGKTGVSGLGMLPVAIYAQLLPAKQASGLLLPLLIVGDLVAVASFRQHTRWRHLWRLFPWTAAGVMAGTFAMGRIDDRQARVLTGLIVLVFVALHLVRRSRLAHGSTAELPGWIVPAVGVLAGVTTLIANAAGPLMAVYLLAMRLPKLEFVGTSAMFFLVLNVFKVPFMMNLGLVNSGSVTANLALAPAVVAGALLGRRILARINQRWFENLALGLAAAAGVKLLF